MAKDQPLLAGLMDRTALRSETGWSHNTIERRIQRGMPVIRVGKADLFDRAAVRAWILSRTGKRLPLEAEAPDPDDRRDALIARTVMRTEDAAA